MSFAKVEYRGVGPGYAGVTFALDAAHPNERASIKMSQVPSA